MAEHTGGPWKAHKSGGGEWWVMAPNDPGDHDYQDDYEPILEASGVGFNFEADAKLAAAAPDMYEYVKVRAERGEETAKRLIAKAEGQS